MTYTIGLGAAAGSSSGWALFSTCASSCSWCGHLPCSTLCWASHLLELADPKLLSLFHWSLGTLLTASSSGSIDINVYTSNCRHVHMWQVLIECPQGLGSPRLCRPVSWCLWLVKCRRSSTCSTYVLPGVLHFDLCCRADTMENDSTHPSYDWFQTAIKIIVCGGVPQPVR
jgi:hypothetical protein